ncbi:MAG TPA: hypothetical protein VFW83_05135 [Bryobacteraceae bacterium]|nr:hypothetical protein [Bryobacteraceae bacterium]
MYGILFREVVAYQNKADRLAAESKPSDFVRNYHASKLQLGAAESARLIEVSRLCVQQIQVIDQKAAAIIQEVKSQYRLSPGVPVPPPPADLAELQSQRTAVLLAAADSLAAAFGPDRFASFEGLVRQHVGSGLRAQWAH